MHRGGRRAPDPDSHPTPPLDRDRDQVRLCKEAGVDLRFVPCDHAKYMRYAELDYARPTPSLSPRRCPAVALTLIPIPTLTLIPIPPSPSSGTPSWRDAFRGLTRTHRCLRDVAFLDLTQYRERYDVSATSAADGAAR